MAHFVTGQNRLTFDLPRMFSLTAYTEESGMRPTRKVLEMSEQVASPAVAKVLQPYGASARHSPWCGCGWWTRFR